MINYEHMLIKWYHTEQWTLNKHTWCMETSQLGTPVNAAAPVPLDEATSGCDTQLQSLPWQVDGYYTILTVGLSLTLTSRSLNVARVAAPCISCALKCNLTILSSSWLNPLPALNTEVHMVRISYVVEIFSKRKFM